MEFILLAVLLGLIPAVIAQGKGRNFVSWWIYGALIFVVALPHALLMKTDRKAAEKMQLEEGMKKCPFCAELIKDEAKVCRYCGRDQRPQNIPAPVAPTAMDAWIERAKSGDWPGVVSKDLKVALERGEVTPEEYAAIRKELRL